MPLINLEMQKKAHTGLVQRFNRPYLIKETKIRNSVATIV